MTFAAASLARVPRDAARRGRAPVPAALVRLRPLPAAPDGARRRHARAREGLRLPRPVVGLLESEGVTGLPGVPTLFGVLLGLRGLGDRELPALRYLSNTGAALSVTTIAGLRETFPAGAHLLHVRPHRVQARVVPAAAPDRRQAGLGRHRDPGHRGLGRGRRRQRVRPGRGRRADRARARTSCRATGTTPRRPPSACAPAAGRGSAS